MAGMKDAPRVAVSSAAQLRAWLVENHASSSGVRPRPGPDRDAPTYDELIEELLAFGWIDGQYAPIDADSSMLWITHRKPRSGWSRLSKERVARVQAVVMDKTGTLTLGAPAVTEVRTDGLDADEVLRLAAAVERESEHPLARAVVAEPERRGLSVPAATSFRAVPGHGAAGQVDGRTVLVGSRRLLSGEGVVPGAAAADQDELAGAGRTAVLVAVDGRAVGVIALADAVRPTSAAAVRALHDLGVRVVMLTGDNQATADRIAAELGIDTVIAEVLPGDKAAVVARLQADGT
ncbi:MAG: HAD-IC family P-type ATPase, partial [Cellulomonas sp.]|nr:HAD-IC family P-type ATPase [Cellulomonas sp.]